MNIDTYNEVPVSKNQLKLWFLFGGELNYKFDYYWLDIYFEEEGIYCEYDGSGHDLSVQNGKMSREEFLHKEDKRREYLKSCGLKEFRILNPHEKKLPKDAYLLKIKQFVFNYLNIDGNDWIIVDFQNKVIWTLDKIIPLKSIY